MYNVTVLLTSCDRLDLLERTLTSFIQYNTYYIQKLLIRDDSGVASIWEDTLDLLHKIEPPFSWDLLKLGQMGQAKSIDYMMKEIRTPYVFHLEDDWQFHRPRFIEDCFAVLGDDIAQVRVRDRDDGTATKTKPYNELADECTNHLFSFNPHLRKVGSEQFSSHTETTLGELVTTLGLKTLWLKEGACFHIGGDKTTNRSGTPYEKGVKKA